MPTRAEAAQAEFEEANRRLDVAQQHEARARAHAEALAQRIAAGDGADVTPAQLADARAQVDHAALAVQGAQRPMAGLSKAVSLAAAEDQVDEVATTLRLLGSRVAAALEELARPLHDLAEAVRAYDAFAAASKQALAYGSVSPRCHHPKYGPPVVDGIALGRSHAARHLARAVLPAMRTGGAPDFALEPLVQLAQAATPLPTVEGQ